jgi:hypothetical protein
MRADWFWASSGSALLPAKEGYSNVSMALGDTRRRSKYMSCDPKSRRSVVINQPISNRHAHLKMSSLLYCIDRSSLQGRLIWLTVASFRAS